jgi:hypothetical protein
MLPTLGARIVAFAGGIPPAKGHCVGGALVEW